MNYIISLVPLAVAAYTLSFASWLWKQEYKRGAVGTVLLTAVSMAVSFYAIFLRRGF